MPVLIVRRVGNSLGVILPKEYVAQKRLKPGDTVSLDLERTLTIEDTIGCLSHVTASVDELMAETNEGEDW